MARGKGGLSSNVVLVTTRPKRAASMPASEHVHYSPSYTAPSLTTSRVSRATSHALDESEALSHQSRRNDQRLLDDITSRLMTGQYHSTPVASSSSSRMSRPMTRRAAYYQQTPATYTTSVPYTPTSSYYSPRYTTLSFAPSPRYPTTSSYGSRAYSTASSNPALRKWRSMSAIPPAPAPVRASSRKSRARLYDDDDDDVYIRRSPRKSRSRARHYDDDGDDVYSMRFPTFDTPTRGNFESRSKRAQSTPACINRTPLISNSSSSTPSTTRHCTPGDQSRMESWFIDRQSPLLMMAEHYRVPDIISPSKSCLNIFEAYQPPRPPRRPVVSRSRVVERQVSPVRLTYRASSLPPPSKLTPSADLAVRNAKASLCRIERELGVEDDMDDYTPRQVAYRPPVAPVRSAARTGFYRGGQPGPSRRHYQSPGPVRRPVEIESKVDYYCEPDFTTPHLGNLRGRFTEARSKMDTHRTMMDKYLPIDMGPRNEVAYEVEHKFGELANRNPVLMPQLDPYRPSANRSSSMPPPARRASVSCSRGLSEYAAQPLRTPAFRPTMSDTRKRCRDVLCKTKGDPHYFAY